MPRIRWFGSSKIHNKAVGLGPAARSYTRAGQEMDVTADVLKALKERYAGQFEVLESKTSGGGASKGSGKEKGS